MYFQFKKNKQPIFKDLIHAIWVLVNKVEVNAHRNFMGN